MFTQNAARASRISQQQAMIELIRNKMLISFPLVMIGWNILLALWAGGLFACNDPIRRAQEACFEADLITKLPESPPHTFPRMKTHHFADNQPKSRYFPARHFYQWTNVCKVNMTVQTNIFFCSNILGRTEMWYFQLKGCKTSLPSKQYRNRVFEAGIPQNSTFYTVLMMDHNTNFVR